MRLAAIGAAFACAAGFVAVGGCAHLQPGGVPVPTPTPAASATAQAACIQTAAANAQIVAISPLITPAVDPTYGLIGGYGLVSGGGSNNVTAPIVVAPAVTVQFFNDDQAGSQLRYSAVGIPNVSAFPSATYTFPPSAASSIGTQISATATWSTGLLGGQCYSQPFTLAGSGTYYFGDDIYYGLANLRDVIVATASPTP